jgi:hypothetical protein
MSRGLKFQCFPIGGNQTKVAPAADTHSRLTCRAIGQRAHLPQLHLSPNSELHFMNHFQELTAAVRHTDGKLRKLIGEDMQELVRRSKPARCHFICLSCGSWRNEAINCRFDPDQTASLKKKIPRL